MAKKKPPSLQQQYALEYAQKLKERTDDTTKKSRNDREEIGCSKVRLWSRVVTVIEWADPFQSVVVEVNGEASRYKWPFTCYDPFLNFEVLEDCGYLDKFANGLEYVHKETGKRYGVKDDVVWAGGKRYLSSVERVKFGSFRDFLMREGEGNFTVKRKII